MLLTASALRGDVWCQVAQSCLNPHFSVFTSSRAGSVHSLWSVNCRQGVYFLLLFFWLLKMYEIIWKIYCSSSESYFIVWSWGSMLCALRISMKARGSTWNCKPWWVLEDCVWSRESNLKQSPHVVHLAVPRVRSLGDMFGLCLQVIWFMAKRIASGRTNM